MHTSSRHRTVGNLALSLLAAGLPPAWQLLHIHIYHYWECAWSPAYLCIRGIYILKYFSCTSFWTNQWTRDAYQANPKLSLWHLYGFEGGKSLHTALSAPSTEVSSPLISVLSVSDRSDPRVIRGALLASGAASLLADTATRGAARCSAAAFFVRAVITCENFLSWMITWTPL